MTYMALPVLGAMTLAALCRRSTTMYGIVVGIRLGWGVAHSAILILISLQQSSQEVGVG
jgi:hypothetical protein